MGTLLWAAFVGRRRGWGLRWARGGPGNAAVRGGLRWLPCRSGCGRACRLGGRLGFWLDCWFEGWFACSVRRGWIGGGGRGWRGRLVGDRGQTLRQNVGGADA